MAHTVEQRIRVPGGEAWAGTRYPIISADGEGIIRNKNLKSYQMDCFAVTNERFSKFIADTHYVTDAERSGWSYVFKGLLSAREEQNVSGISSEVGWWWAVDGAYWKKPKGPNGADAIENHPVVHVSWNDANAFANWSGGRLPSEIEWEHAARGDKRDIRYPWGDHDPIGYHNLCNIWHGEFPYESKKVDGYIGTMPANSFDPNNLGLFNMCGNIWEWTACAFRIQSVNTLARKRNTLSRLQSEKVLKGGSYLCHQSYCWRYRIAARVGRARDTSACHVGFRLAH